MSSYNQLADLESLKFSITDSTVRAYAADAIISYAGGANRASIVSIWIAVVYDLYQKMRYLAEQFENGAAKQYVEKIERIRNNSTSKNDNERKDKASDWEATILETAYNQVKMLSEVEYKMLERIREDRHLCAHPVLDQEGLLFQPSAEQVRTHIRSAIEILLSQPALIGRTRTEALVGDIEGAYMPDDFDGVKKAITNRHLIPANDNYRIAILYKSLTKMLYEEAADSKFISRYSLVIKIIYSESPQLLEKLERSKLESIFNKTSEQRYLDLLDLLETISFLWKMVPDFTKIKLQQFLLQEGELLHKIKALPLFPELREPIKTAFATLEVPELRQLLILLDDAKISMAPNDYSNILKDLVQQSICKFTKSETFQLGKQNSRILPVIAPFMTADDVAFLLTQVFEDQKAYVHDQLVDAALAITGVFEQTISKFPEQLPRWKDFVEQKTNRQEDGTITYQWRGIDQLSRAIARSEA